MKKEGLKRFVVVDEKGRYIANALPKGDDVYATTKDIYKADLFLTKEGAKHTAWDEDVRGVIKEVQIIIKEV